MLGMAALMAHARAPLRARPAQRAGAAPRRAPTAVAALTKEAKQETVDKLKGQLSESTLVLSFDYSLLSVKRMMEFRRAMAADTQVIVCKNTLMRRAAEETEGWESLASATKGTNAWIFVRDDFKSAIKPFKELKKELKKEREIERDFNAGCLEGEMLTEQQLDAVEDLPSKTDLIAKIASMINQPVVKIAYATKAVPNKLGYASKALSDKLEETGAATAAEFAGAVASAGAPAEEPAAEAPAEEPAAEAPAEEPAAEEPAAEE